MTTYARTALWLALVLALATAALAQPADSSPAQLLQEADYAARIAEDYGKAVQLYQQVIDHAQISQTEEIQARLGLGLAWAELGRDEQARQTLQQLLDDHSDRPELANKIRTILADLIPLDPATLMPPDTVAYIELGSPGHQIETLLQWLQGTPFENPLAAMGMNQQQSQSQNKNPADILAALLNPSMLAEMKKLRGIAVGVTSLEGAFHGPGAPFVAVLQPGKSDAIRGILQAALAMAGQPDDPIEGMDTLKNIGGQISAAYDDRIILLAMSRDQLSSSIHRYHGATSQPCLALDNPMFASLQQQTRNDNLLTVWINGPSLHSQLREQFSSHGRIPPQFLLAENLLGLADLQNGCLQLALLPKQGISLDAQIVLAPGHRCFAYDLVRTPNLQPAAFNAIPSDAVVIASVSLGDGSSALANQFDASVQRLTGLDVGRELFANLQQITLFVLPPDPAETHDDSALARNISPVVSRIGLACTSNDPQRTLALFEKLLNVAYNINAAQTGYALAQNDLRKTLVAMIGKEPVHIYFGQQGNASFFTLNPAVLDSALACASRQAGAANAGPLRHSIHTLPDQASKVVLANLGGVLRLATRHHLKSYDTSSPTAQKLLELCEQLAQTCDPTTIELFTNETPDTLAVHVKVNDMPTLASVLPLVMQIQQLGPQNSARREKSRRPSSDGSNPVPAHNGRVGPEGPFRFTWWSMEQNVQHYRIYCGDDPQELSLVPGAQVTETFYIPDNIDFQPDTTYYWRVDTVYSDGRVTSRPLWKFTTDGQLVGHWKLDESDGAVAPDASSFHRNGVAVGNPQWQPHTGQHNGAILLDGIEDAVSIPDFQLEADSATFTAWIKGHKAADWAGILFSRAPGRACGIHFADDNSLHYTWNNNNEACYRWPGPEIAPDQWNFLAVTIEPDRATAYVLGPDGQLRQKTNGIRHTRQSFKGLNIGYDPEQVNNRRFAVLIDDTRVYNYALSPDEIHQLATTP